MHSFCPPHLVFNEFFLARYWTLSVPTILPGSRKVKLLRSYCFKQWIFHFTGEKPSCPGQLYQTAQSYRALPANPWAAAAREEVQKEPIPREGSAVREWNAPCRADRAERRTRAMGAGRVSKNRFWQSPGKTCFLWAQLCAKVQRIQQGMTEMKGLKFVWRTLLDF